MRTVSDLELEAAVAFLRVRRVLYMPQPPIDITGLIRSFAGPEKTVRDVKDIPTRSGLSFCGCLTIFADDDRVACCRRYLTHHLPFRLDALHGRHAAAHQPRRL
jgi:hypothetical protein